MKKHLDIYKGAAIYEIHPSEGKALGSKLIAKALIPNQENMKVDFIEEAATLDEAMRQIKNAIDNYLLKHELEMLAPDTQ